MYIFGIMLPYILSNILIAGTIRVILNMKIVHMIQTETRSSLDTRVVSTRFYREGFFMNFRIRSECYINTTGNHDTLFIYLRRS